MTGLCNCRVALPLLFVLSLLPAATASPNNLLKPIANANAWPLFTRGGGAATVARVGNTLVVTVTATDGTDTRVQVAGQGLDLTDGTPYTLSFSAKAGTPQILDVRATVDDNDRHEVGLFRSVILPTHWTRYRMDFTAQGTEPGHVLVPQFMLGRQVGMVWISDVSLVASPPQAPAYSVIQPGELRLTGTVEQKSPSGLTMWVTGVVGTDGLSHTVQPPHQKSIRLTDATSTVTSLSLTPQAVNSINLGDPVVITGHDGGLGKALVARQIVVGGN